MSRIERDTIQIGDPIHPPEIELQSPVLREIHAKLERSLPIVVSVPLGRAAPIIDGRKVRRVPTGERRCQIYRSFLPGQIGTLSNRRKSRIRRKRRCCGVSRPRLVVILITPPMASDPHIMLWFPRKISIRSMLSVVKLAKS